MIVTNIKALQIALKALAPFCADDSNRFAIEGTLIRGTNESVFVVATDGKKMAVAEIAEVWNNENENYILSAHTCEWIIKLSPTNSRLVFASNCIKQIDLLTNNETCGKRVGSDGKTRLYIDGSFPPFEQVIPLPKNESAPTSIALEVLADLGTFCKTVNKNRAKGERATMRIQTSATSATLAICVGEFGTLYTVVMMPCAGGESLAVYLHGYRAKFDGQRAAMKTVEDARAPNGSEDDSNDPTSVDYIATGSNLSPSKIEAILAK